MDNRTAPDKIEKAVALRYDPKKEQAPVVVAQGQGYIAEAVGSGICPCPQSTADQSISL